MSPFQAARAYSQVGVETGVGAADARRLLIMLYDGVLACLREARGHMQRGEVPAKCAALSKAVRIIQEGLLASLDRDSGGEIGASLAELYEYIVRRIALGNARNDPALIDEAARLLGELRGAWAALAERKAA